MNEASIKKTRARVIRFVLICANAQVRKRTEGWSRGGCASKTCVGLPRIKEGSPRC